MMTAAPCALTIAGSDSGGGAGIQADLATFRAHGLHGGCALTAVTAQSTAGVSAIGMLSAELLSRQLDCVSAELDIGALKTGMLGSRAHVEVVAAWQRTRAHPLVLDPVLVATSGAALGERSLAVALLEQLVPLAELVTPNIPEAEALTGLDIATAADQLDAGHRLLQHGCGAALVKGGHLSGASVADVLVHPDGHQWFEHGRRAGRYHGTGCVLSAAVCARRARGEPLAQACAGAIDYLQQCMAAAWQPAAGELLLLRHPPAAG